MTRIAWSIAICLIELGSAQAAVTKGPYLLYSGTNTEMKVLWQLDRSETCTVDWGRTIAYTDGTTEVTELDASTHRYQAVLSNLQPGTKYYYRVTESTGERTGSFVAAPASDASQVKLLMYGDTRSNPGEQDKVSQQMVAAFADGYQTLLLHSGDWVNTDAESNWTNEFFARSYTNNLAVQAAVPILGVRGNHEGSGTIFRKYWPFDHLASSFYGSVDYGPVHVVFLDQYVSYTAGSAQHTWLVDDLRATTKEFRVIVLHEPGWTAAGGHGNNATVQSVLQPLAEQYKVDMVVGGHNHYYARADVDGVRHLTLGGGGAPLYSPASGQPYVVVSKMALHFAKVEVQGNTMTVQIVEAPSGTILDTFSFTHPAPSDTTTPTPDPMSFATAPAAASSSSIVMTATTATDASGVEYFFECASTGCRSSTWQTSPVYEDAGLQPNTSYRYRVRARDRSANGNETQFSPPATATTLARDNVPPSPPTGLVATVSGVSAQRTNGSDSAMLDLREEIGGRDRVVRSSPPAAFSRNAGTDERPSRSPSSPRSPAGRRARR